MWLIATYCSSLLPNTGKSKKCVHAAQHTHLEDSSGVFGVLQRRRPEEISARNAFSPQLFLRLPRACLGKMIIFSIQWHQKRRFVPLIGLPPRAQNLWRLRDNTSFVEFSLGLSRACLGKVIMFEAKTEENGRERPCSHLQRRWRRTENVYRAEETTCPEIPGLATGHTARILGGAAAMERALRENAFLFQLFRFPYVCPEPVLVKRSS